MPFPTEILGDQFGVRIEPRRDKEPASSPRIILLCEDDGRWHETGTRFDSAWLDDLRKVIERAYWLVDEAKEGDNGGSLEGEAGSTPDNRGARA